MNQTTGKQLNITILVNKDLASNLALNYLLPKLKRHNVSLFYSSHVGGTKKLPLRLQNLQFFEQQLFEQLLFPFLDESSKKTKPKYLSFDHLAERANTRFECLNHINTAEGLEVLKFSEPDLILSIRFGKILKEEAIAIPKLGILNLHSGLLPQYQGVMATFWAMLNKESYYGTTLHFIDSPAIDAGPVVTRTESPLDLSKSYLQNVLELYKPGVESISQAVLQLSEVSSLSTTQPTERADYYSFPSEKDIDKFEEQGAILYSAKEMAELSFSFLS